MTRVMKFFWSASGLAIYLYAITILVQNGYNDYFYIPRNFIESSLVANITFFWAFIPSLWTLVTSGLFIGTVFVVLLIGAIIYYDFSNSFFKRVIEGIIILAVTGFAFYLLYHAYSFGMHRGEETSSFYLFKEDCSPVPVSKTIKYIGPIISEGKVVLVPINASNTLQTGFRVIDLASISCGLEIKNVGLIKH